MSPKQASWAHGGNMWVSKGLEQQGIYSLDSCSPQGLSLGLALLIACRFLPKIFHILGISHFLGFPLNPAFLGLGTEPCSFYGEDERNLPCQELTSDPTHSLREEEVGINSRVACNSVPLTACRTDMILSIYKQNSCNFFFRRHILWSCSSILDLQELVPK